MYLSLSRLSGMSFDSISNLTRLGLESLGYDFLAASP
jgi:hypothetical protein